MEESALWEWRSEFLSPPQKIYVRICAKIKIARRKVGSTKQFIKDSILTRRESGRAQRYQLPQGVTRVFSFYMSGVLGHG